MKRLILLFFLLSAAGLIQPVMADDFFKTGKDALNKSLSAIVSDPQKGSREIRLLPLGAGRQSGHPKLVAILVGEDYARRPGGPDWGELGELPGVWQDLARMKATLKALGFGKVIVLGGGQSQGSRREITVRDYPVKSGRAVKMSLSFDGPAKRSAIIEAAGRLRSHLYNNRLVDDGGDGYVPPLFLFYYTGHGFIDTKGVHRIPLSDHVTGERTGDLLNEVIEIVGADDAQRGGAGGGASLVLMDSCHSGKSFGELEKASKTGEGLLEKGIMDAIRAGRKGRYFLGSSLGDEKSKEGRAGGYFTMALCEALAPDRLGRNRETEATLSLHHLARDVDQILLDRGGQAVSRFPPASDIAWDNFVLFSNPHYRAPGVPLRLFVAATPAWALIQGQAEGAFMDLESLGFTLSSKIRSGDMRIYRVPESWRGKTIRLRAVPHGKKDWEKYTPSDEKSVEFKADSTGVPLNVVLALKPLRTSDKAEFSVVRRMQELIKKARNQSDPLDQYRLYHVVLAMEKDATADEGILAEALVKDVRNKLIVLRPRAGKKMIEKALATVEFLAARKHYRKAYDRLLKYRENHKELNEFNLSEEYVTGMIEEVRSELIGRWTLWADNRRKKEAQKRLAAAERLMESGLPWDGWQRAFEAGTLVGEGDQVLKIKDLSQEAVTREILLSIVTIEDLYSKGLYSLLWRLQEGEGSFPDALKAILDEQYNLGEQAIKEKVLLSKERFLKVHEDWFPPVAAGETGPSKMEIRIPRLHSEPRRRLSKKDVKSMLAKYNFYDSDWHKSGDFKNDFVDNRDGTVTDRVTGLMWQKSGSDRYMRFGEAQKYIDGLKDKGFAGHKDWRLPTLEELASLIEREKKNGLYVDPVFDRRQKWCWSADKRSSGSAWLVSFLSGEVSWGSLLVNVYYVRAVRSWQ